MHQRLIFASAVLSIVLCGCGTVAPPSPDFPASTSSVRIPAVTPNHGKVVFLNEHWSHMPGARPNNAALLDRHLNKSLGSGKADIEIDGKKARRIAIGEYTQVMLPYGTHEVKARSPDSFGTKTYRLDVSRPWMLVRVHPGMMIWTWEEREVDPALVERTWGEAR